MHEEDQAWAALLKPGCGLCAELDWKGVDELGVTPVSRELSCSEDMQTGGAPGVFPQLLLYG